MFGLAWRSKNLFKPIDTEFIINLGDQLAETRWFKRFYLKALKNNSCRALARKNYHGVHPTLSELKLYPTNTLGYHYSQHIIKNNLSIYERRDPKLLKGSIYFRDRSREFHDIIHVVYGFGVAIQDELGLNAVIIAQHKYPVSAAIIIGGLLRIALTQIKLIPQAFKQIYRGYQLGLKTESIFSVAWEEYWMSDLTTLRKQMNIQI